MQKPTLRNRQRQMRTEMTEQSTVRALDLGGPASCARRHNIEKTYNR